MRDFDLPVYAETNHSLERYEERKVNSDSLLESVQKGKVVYDDGKQRYVLSDGLLYPMLKEDQSYVVKTVLTKEMLVRTEEELFALG